MFYDAPVRHPWRGAEAIDRYVARLEVVTGTPLRVKINRLGRGQMACRGLVLGNNLSLDDWYTADHADSQRVSVTS